ncbi:MAG: sulfite exporter TauE/SafE family protein [Gammaproteobacteria bacterium]
MDPTSPSGIALIFLAALTSFITASLGAGGGVMMLAILAQVLPPQVIIPVHGIVQLGSNSGRAAMSWRHIDWSIIGLFFIGSVFGAALASLVLVTLTPRAIYLIIAAFTLFLCWGPRLPSLALGRFGAATTGLVTTFLTMFAGATGPLVAAFITQRHTEKFATVATFGAAMSVQHTFKAVVFQAAGFDLRPWIWLMIAMVISGAIGTWCGLRLLRRFPAQHFQTVFKIVLSLLAIRLLWQAIR